MTETTASASTVDPSPAPDSASRTLPIASTALAVGGLVLLGWAGWSVYQTEPPPYRYELITEGGIEQFPELGLADRTGLHISKYEIRIDDAGDPLAVVLTGTGHPGDPDPVLLDWQNLIDEPVIAMPPPADEFAELLAAVETHLPPDAQVLGWWDTTRRLALLSETETPFTEHLVRPLIVPDVWRNRVRGIEEAEIRFWRAGVNTDTGEAPFRHYQDALLANPASGIEMLRELAPTGNAYLVLHVTDAYKLGEANPDRFGIGYKDFPNTGNIHAVSGHVKKWLKENGYETFTARKHGAASTRVYFLTDAPSANTLIAQALPFTTSRAFDLEHLRIVYQSGGYWVYQLP